ncbi:MAG: phosphate ABC transporter permease subunit PstC [Sphaerochaeta sp.]|jgi:phosphate transport system permease protein|nr:phosphate ABC transporter permease subunit PstC [Sphaerochaeta sp.]MCH3919794.1 phosphate ABC transporter permease subunit PstC [Sphaerochaeta sp.]MCI2045700.1 phosphate ABC transporter permease subunit PstC [Sphaerochaeta sp.]MCI2076444.1 phosphate ABC transporter permease subunit PstC [Sphaerochaeta sp.]MCI2096642.1 phosphate ABC transporter permease subunit PstC [Sphaerochaeta sp.]
MDIRSRKRIERGGRVILLASALVCVATVALITIFIFAQGIPTFRDVPLTEFLFSTNWSPSAADPHYGVLSFIVASFIVTGLSLLFATPISLATAVYLALFAKGRKAAILRESIELLSGIPSIIYGLFGIAVVVPFVRNVFGGNGYSLLSAALILAIMILPTIINISEVSISAVSPSLKEASVALGATTWQTISRVILPSARSGIVASLVMALGRAVGETTAVLLVGGNAPLFPKSPVSMGRTLTMNIVTDMSYAEGVHMSALFATAMLLFFFILALNLFVIHATHRREK